MAEEKEDSPQLPMWYLKLEKIAGKLAAGTAAAEISLQFSKSFLPIELVNILHLFLIPFGIICLVFSGYNALDTLKKMKANGK